LAAFGADDRGQLRLTNARSTAGIDSLPESSRMRHGSTTFAAVPLQWLSVLGLM
jgi:hypothetical protein